MASKKKAATTVVAVATAAALLLGGTFAWQSISQTALNEASDVINPGGRLHNDMWYVSPEENNNDIYVENFDKEDIFARVRLEEYFEIVLNYGTNGEKSVPIIGTKTETGEFNANGTPKYDYEYVRFTGYEDYASELQAGKEVGVDGSENAYWTWQMGGETVFMPTFNKNKDSLLPDLNGIYEDGNVGTISNRGTEQYDWTEWGDGETKPANEIWDIDSNDVDELEALSFLDLAKLIDGADDAPTYDADAVTLVNETHEAKSTQSAELVSMTEWMSWFDDGNGGYDANLYDPDVYGNYWVYDDTEGGDGWVYWSAKLAGGEATGLLLNGTTLNQVMDDTWYYAINAVGQFCTPDDTGVDPLAAAAYNMRTASDTDTQLPAEGTGFYADGETVTLLAQEFLRIIGATDTTPGYPEGEMAMTFGSSPEYVVGEEGPYVEIPMSSSESSVWNLYDCSEGKFTLTSDNPDVTFEPYEEAPENTDWYILIPAGTTESFTVTATAVESGKQVTFTVIMVESNEPDYYFYLQAAGYTDEDTLEGYGSIDHIAVNKKYSLRAYVSDDQNPADCEDEGYAVDFTVTLDNGEPLTEGDDYTLRIMKPQFEKETVTTENGEERIEYAAYADLTILDEDLIGEFVTVEASTPNGESDFISDVVIQEHRIELAVQLFDTGSDAEFTDFVVGPNETYDVRVTANIEDIGEIVIFDSRADHKGEIDSRIVGFVLDDLETWNGEDVSINESGQFVTGSNPGFIGEEYDSFNVGATIKDLRIVEGETILWRGYATGTTEWLYCKGHAPLEFNNDNQFTVNADQGKTDGVPLMVGLSTCWEVEGITFDVTGNRDSGTKIVPMDDEDLKGQGYYYRLILGEDETSDAITFTAKKTGYIDSAPAEFTIIYPKTLNISIEGSPDEVERGEEYTLNVSGYEGDLSNLVWSTNGSDRTFAYYDGGWHLHVDADETAESLTITARSEDPYAIGMFTVPVKITPTITLAEGDDTLTSLDDTVQLQLNDYSGTVTWKADSADVTVTPDENGVVTVAFKTFEGTEAPSAYTYTIRAMGEDDIEIGAYDVKYWPETYTVVHAVYNAYDQIYVYEEISAGDSMTLNAHRYQGWFSIKETALVQWTATDQVEPSFVYSGGGSLNEIDLPAGTYAVQAAYSKPDGTIGRFDFTVTVEDSGLDM